MAKKNFTCKKCGVDFKNPHALGKHYDRAPTHATEKSRRNKVASAKRRAAASAKRRLSPRANGAIKTNGAGIPLVADTGRARKPKAPLATAHACAHCGGPIDLSDYREAR